MNVLAIAAGTVIGTRDGVVDRIVRNERDRRAVRGIECGNGVSIRHADGHISQFCHMKRGSISVAIGDLVAQGDTLGEMGMSGFTTFPHIHLTLRSPSGLIDPLTGKSVGKASCQTVEEIQPEGPFGQASKTALLESSKAILNIGLAGAPFPFEDLKQGAYPALPTTQSPSTIAWSWMINLKRGDRIFTRIDIDGTLFSKTLSQPLDRNKAAFYTFAGRKRPPKAGTYRVQVELRRQGKTVRRAERAFDIR